MLQSDEEDANINRSILWLIALLSLLSLPALGADFGERLRVNGFYGLEANYSDTDNATIPGSTLQLDRNELNFEYSLIGAQADFQATEKLSFSLQSIVSKQTSSSYDPSVEWAYLNYDLGNDTSVRGGKFKIPFLQGTELQYVGFSRLWVRPLLPTSGAGGFNDYRGIDLLKNSAVGGYNLSFQAALGEAEHELEINDNGKIALVSGRIERNESWVKLALLNARYDVFTPSGRPLQDDVDKLSVSLETEQRFGRWMVNAGYVYGDADLSPKDQLAYLSLGYRHNRLTPYVLYQYSSLEFDPSEFPTPPPGPMPPPPGPPLPPPPGPPPPSPPPSPHKDGRLSIDSYALGFRYDLGPTYAIKAQVEHQRLRDNSEPAADGQRIEANIFTLVFEGVF